MVTAVLTLVDCWRSAGSPASTDRILPASSWTCAGKVDPMAPTPERTLPIHGFASVYCCCTCFSWAAITVWTDGPPTWN